MITWLLIFLLSVQAPYSVSVQTIEDQIEDQIEEVVNPNYEIITMRVTSYAPLDNKSGICADENPTMTATMTFPSRGTIAVNPRKIPYGTKLEVPGYGSGVALDTGGALRNYEGYAIDLYMDTYKQAMEWGVQYLEVKVYCND